MERGRTFNQNTDPPCIRAVTFGAAVWSGGVAARDSVLMLGLVASAPTPRRAPARRLPMPAAPTQHSCGRTVSPAPQPQARPSQPRLPLFCVWRDQHAARLAAVARSALRRRRRVVERTVPAQAVVAAMVVVYGIVPASTKNAVLSDARNALLSDRNSVQREAPSFGGAAPLGAPATWSEATPLSPPFRCKATRLSDRNSVERDATSFGGAAPLRAPAPARTRSKVAASQP